MYQTNTIVPRSAFIPIGDTVPQSIEELVYLLDDNGKPPENCYDEIIPNLFIGDEFSATNIKKLRVLEITHIVNAAQGTSSFHFVDTDPSYYSWSMFPCKYLGLPVSDVPDFEISQYFGLSASFIDNALHYRRSARVSKVLVHSLEGRSRSATIVAAYLMLYKKMSALDAMHLIKTKRNVHPNDGFLQQLCDLEFLLELRAKEKAENESDDSEDEDTESKDAKPSQKRDQGQGQPRTNTNTTRETVTTERKKLQTGKTITEDDYNNESNAAEDFLGDIDQPMKRSEKKDALGAPDQEVERSPSGKKSVRFSEDPQVKKFSPNKSPNNSPICKVHPNGKGTPPVRCPTPCKIHGDSPKITHSPKSPRGTPCKAHPEGKKPCAVHGDSKQNTPVKSPK